MIVFHEYLDSGALESESIDIRSDFYLRQADRASRCLSVCLSVCDNLIREAFGVTTPDHM